MGLLRLLTRNYLKWDHIFKIISMNNKKPSCNRITAAWHLAMLISQPFNNSWSDCCHIYTPAIGLHQTHTVHIATFFMCPALCSCLQVLLYFKLKLKGWMTHFVYANWWVLDSLASLSHRFLRMIPHGSVVLAESSTLCVFQIFEIWLPPNPPYSFLRPLKSCLTPVSHSEWLSAAPRRRNPSVVCVCVQSAFGSAHQSVVFTVKTVTGS